MRTPPHRHNRSAAEVAEGEVWWCSMGGNRSAAEVAEGEVW
jgi:hypothetical protein